MLALTTLNPLTLKALNFLWKPWRSKGFFQFEIMTNVLVSSFWFIWIPMLSVYDHYKYFYYYSAGMDYRRQILTTKVYPHAVRVKPSRCIKASFYIPENRLNFPTTGGFKMKISMKLVYQYMAIFINFHPLQIIFIHYKSRIATAIRGL